MKFSAMTTTITTALVGAAVGGFVVFSSLPDSGTLETSSQQQIQDDDTDLTLVKGRKTRHAGSKIKVQPPQPIPEFVNNGIAWLVEAQHSSGGWGAGSHAQQTNIDPAKVKLDPATTAFAGMALMRAGHTPVQGVYRDAVRKTTEFLVDVVEKSKAEGPRITDMTGTQPQAKLGQLVDTTMTTQFLSRVITSLPNKDPLHDRASKALDKCLLKLQSSQQKNGSWGSGGWAPVLQSSLGTTALELAQVAGKQVDMEDLRRARDYQKGNFDPSTGKANASAAAGVELYAFAGAQRATAGEARAAQQLIDEAKKNGKLEPADTVNLENLRKIGVDDDKARELADADIASKAQIARLNDENLLRGFGNNGGEEFLSYLMTSESLVITGGESWKAWNQKIIDRLGKIQNPNGSWNGHHCISSPVFCTAAVIQCCTTDRDAVTLIQIAQNATKLRQAASQTAGTR
jgi:hypothetical protein